MSVRNKSYRSQSIYRDSFEARNNGDGGNRAVYSAANAQDGGLKERLESILDVLYRRKYIVVLTFVAVMAYTVYSELNRVDLYESKAFVMVDLTRRPSGEQSLIPQSPMGLNTERNLFTELFILQNSGAIHERVSRQIKVLRATNQLKRDPDRGAVRFGAAGRGIDNIIEIAVTSTRPQDASMMANMYAQEYVTQTQDVSRSNLTASRNFLEKQEESHRNELRSTEESIEQYKRATGAVALSREGSAVVTQIAGLEADRDNTRIELQMRRATLASLEDELENINPQLARRVASDTETRLKNAQEALSKAENSRQLALLRNPNLTRTSPELAGLDRDIAQLRTVIGNLSQTLVDEVMAVGGANIEGDRGLAYATELKKQTVKERIDISGLEAKLSVIESRLGQQQTQLRQIPEQEIELARLERARQHSEQMYQYLITRLQETRVNEGSEPGYAKIIRQAYIPSVPKNTSSEKTVVVNFFLALGLGITLAMVRDKVDNRVYKPAALRASGYNVVSVLPDLTPVIKKEHHSRKYVEQDGRKFSSSFVTLLNPFSSASEAYRGLRTAIQFSRPDSVVQTILVSSSTMEEGKSTTSVNLAIVMAQAGRRTLLVDADLRRPRLHELFGETLKPGLVQLLFSKDDFNPEDYKTGIDNLYMIKAGGSLYAGEVPVKADTEEPPGDNHEIGNPSELLGSKRMRELIDRFRARFDVIIIDSPPVLVATDSPLLSTQADATLLLVRAGKTKEGDLQESLRMLEEVGARVMGIVFNGFDIAHAYGYSYRYNQYSRKTDSYYGKHRKKRLFSRTTA